MPANNYRRFVDFPIRLDIMYAQDLIDNKIVL